MYTHSFSTRQKSDKVLATLTSTREIVEDEDIGNEAQNENHEVFVVLHTNWSYNKCGKWKIQE